MESRLKFLPDKQKEFLLKVQIKSNLSTDELAKFAGVVPRSFRDWKREKLTMSLKAANIFYKKFGVSLPENKQLLINRWKQIKNNAAKIGAIARFKKYGKFCTPEGCRKGGLNSIRKRYGSLLKPFHRPRLSAKLAELVGILLGDGGITKEQWFITVNSNADFEYTKYLSKLVESLFKFKPPMYKKKDCNALVLYGSGKRAIKFLTKIGLKTGNKVKQQVSVPQWINERSTLKISCLRGLMDTDGGIFLHKYKVNGKQYKYYKICFSNRSLPLLNFVYETLTELGLTPKIIDKVENKKVWLYNYEEVKQYLKLVGTHNPRLLKL